MICKSSLILALIFMITGLVKGADPQVSEAYRDGRAALLERDFQTALKHFQSAVNEGGDDLEGALYWSAYSFGKLNNKDAAIRVLERLFTNHPDSPWIDQAETLLGELSGEALDMNQEMRQLALTSLMNAPPEEALPILTRLLNGDGNLDEKRRVLLILGLQGGDEAFDLIEGIARGESSPELQVDAIRSIALRGGARAANLMDALFAEGNAEVQDAVVSGWMASGKTEKLRMVVDQGQGEVRRKALQFMAMSMAASELIALYEQAEDKGTREVLLNGLQFNDGAGDFMMGLARNGNEMEREAAYRHLAMKNKCDELAELFDAVDEAGQAGIAEALVMTRCDFFADIAVSASSPKTRAQLLTSLSLSRAVSADFLKTRFQEDHHPDVRKAAVNGLMLQDAVDTLIELARDVEDRSDKLMIMRVLSNMDNKKARAFMLEILEEQ